MGQLVKMIKETQLQRFLRSLSAFAVSQAEFLSPQGQLLLNQGLEPCASRHESAWDSNLQTGWLYLLLGSNGLFPLEGGQGYLGR